MSTPKKSSLEGVEEVTVTGISLAKSSRHGLSHISDSLGSVPYASLRFWDSLCLLPTPAAARPTDTPSDWQALFPPRELVDSWHSFKEAVDLEKETKMW